MILLYNCNFNTDQYIKGLEEKPLLCENKKSHEDQNSWLFEKQCMFNYSALKPAQFC